MQKRIATDLLSYLPAKFLPALTAFITVPIFTRLFSPDQYGNYMLAFGISEFLLAGTSTGLIAGALRFYTAYRIESRLPAYFASLLTSVAGISLLVAGISVAVLIAFRSSISPGLYPLLWASIVLFVVNGLFATLMQVVRAQEKSRQYTVFELFNRYGGVAFSLALILLLGMSAEGMLWGQALALLIPIVPLVLLTTGRTGVRREHIDRAAINHLWRYAWPLALGNLALWSLRLSDRYIIEAFRGTYEVGLYSVSYNISGRSIDLVVGLFLMVPGPILMRTWEERGRRATEESLTMITRMFLMFVIPAVVGISIIAAPVVSLLADKPYFEGYRAIWLVAISSMAFGLGQLGSLGILVSNRTRLITITQFIAAGASLAISFLTVPIFGYMGAAASAAVSFCILAGSQGILSSRFLTWRWPVKSLVRILAASGVMAVAMLLVQALIDSGTSLSQAITVMAAVLVGGLAYGIGLWVFREISPAALIRLVSPGPNTAAAKASPK